MQRSLRVVLQLALLGVVFAAGWVVHARVAGDGGGEQVGEPAGVAPAQMAVPVRSAQVVLGELPRVLPILAVVRASPGSEWSLSSRSGGRVVAVHGASGQEVHVGEALVEFERAPLEAALSTARAEEHAATLALGGWDAEQERRTLELASAAQHAASALELSAQRSKRIAALVTDGLAAPKAAEEAEGEYAQAQRELELANQARESFRAKGAELERATRAAALDARRATLREATALLEAAVLRAPADGQLTSFELRAGDRLEPGASAGTLLAHSGRVLVCAVSPADLPAIHPGLEASWVEPGVGTRTGRVTAAATALDPVTGAAQVRIAPDANDAQAPGLCVRGEIVLERIAGALLVPEAALVRAEGHSAVVRVGGDGIAHLVQVEVLARHAGQVALKGELRAGDAVVIEGAYNLPEGARTVALGEAK